MLTLRVTSIDGQPPPRPIDATFAEAGGTIGRSDDNHLVLPDSERYISRTHARVDCEQGVFSIAVLGANPIEVNGAPIVRGAVVELNDGDVLRIAGYVVGVRASRPVVEASPVSRPPRNPADDFLVPPGGPGHRGITAAMSTASDSDPLGLYLGREPSGFAQPPSSAGRIPDDFDPFAEPTASSHRPAATPVRDNGSLGLGALLGQAPSIDSLFDLAPGGEPDPFAGGALSDGASSPGISPSLDPLAPWQGSPRPASAPSQADAVPEIHGSFRLPRSRSTPPPVATPPATNASAAAPDNSVFLSWNEDSDEVAQTGPSFLPTGERPPDPLQLFGNQESAADAGDPLGLGPAIKAVRPAIAGEAFQRASLPPAPPMPRQPESTPRSEPPFEQPVAAPPGAASAQKLDPLTTAFVKGLGTANVVAAPLTVEQMEQVGALLREATSGTLALLLARAMTKREVRADVTMIVAKGNNPLKFSPNVDVALAHLMASRRPGFLTPVDAMRDAYDDLRSHQFGFMAGLRAALAGVLKRFDPATLEKRLTARSVLDNVLPMNRRAKLWDQYEQLYRDIAVEAEEDFHTLFGREFLRAYEDQVAKLADDEQRESPGSR